MVCGKLSANLYVINTCFAEIMASNGILSMACKQFSGTFTFLGSGAVKHFVITTSFNRVSKANINFKAAKRLGNMTGFLIKI